MLPDDQDGAQGRGRVRRAQIPERYFPPGGHSGEPWEYLFYSNLVSDFIDEILDGGRVSQGDFAQGALVQETINAFEASFRQPGLGGLPARRRRARRTRREGHDQRRPAGPPGAGRRGVARPRRPARLPGGARRPAVPAAGHGRGHAGRALRRPGHRLRLRPPGARRVGPAPRPRREHGAAVPDLRGQPGAGRPGPGRRGGRPRHRPARVRAGRLPRGGRGRPDRRRPGDRAGRRAGAGAARPPGGHGQELRSRPARRDAGRDQAGRPARGARGRPGPGRGDRRRGRDGLGVRQHRPDGRLRRGWARTCRSAWRGCGSATSWRWPTPTTGTAAATGPAT